MGFCRFIRLFGGFSCLRTFYKGFTKTGSTILHKQDMLKQSTEKKKKKMKKEM